MHGLDAETWKKVDVVYIDIADRSQVEQKVRGVSPHRHCPPPTPAACRFLTPSLSPGLQAGGGSLQVQVGEDGTRTPGTRLEGSQDVREMETEDFKNNNKFLDGHYFTNIGIHGSGSGFFYIFFFHIFGQ